MSGELTQHGVRFEVDAYADVYAELHKGSIFIDIGGVPETSALHLSLVRAMKLAAALHQAVYELLLHDMREPKGGD